MPSKQILSPSVESTLRGHHLGIGCGPGYDYHTASFLGNQRARTFDSSWGNTPEYFSVVSSGNPLPDQPLSVSIKEKEVTADLVCYKANELFDPNYNGAPCTRTESYERRVLMAHMLGTPGAVSPIHGTTQSRQRAIDRMKGFQVNAPVFFAELGKTASMVTSTAETLVNLVRQLRRGDIRGFVGGLRYDRGLSHYRHGKVYRKPILTEKDVESFDKQFGKDAVGTAANTWLAYQYGWIPFMMDVRNAVNTTLDLLDHERSTEIRVQGSSRKSETFTDNAFVVEVSPQIIGVETVTVEEWRRVTWRGGLLPGDLPGKFGLLNPLEVAWELVPFSFVADWFLPIGDYLSNLDVPFRFSHRGGSEGFKQIVTRIVSATSSDYWDTVSGTGWTRHTSVQRTPLGGLPMPSFSEIGLNFDLGARRVTSAIALLSQNLKSLRTR